MTDLSIIIVNYNVKEFILSLLESIRKALAEIPAEIIIVDNNSDDGSVELLRERHPDVNLIVNEKNIGFGAANNLALSRAKGKFLLLINPDTIVREDTFSRMISFFETHADAGIAGCKVLNPDGSLQLACRRGFPGPWTSFTKVMGLSRLFPKSKIFARYNLTYLDENRTYEVDAVSGAFLMMRREVFETIGGFDPQFFMYGEDLDLCYRSQKAGFKVYYVHNTEIIHYKGESTKRSSIDETRVFYDAMHLFVRKHFSSSFIVESILQLAIVFRKLIAFANANLTAISAFVLDAAVLAFSVYFAEKIYAHPEWPGFPDFVKPWIYIVPAILQVIISFAAGAYRKNSISVLRSALALIYGLIILSALTYFFKQFAFSRAVVLISYLIALVVFSLWRIVFKIVFRTGLITETRKARTLIVGSEKSSFELAGKLKSNVSRLYNIVGFIGMTRRSIGESIGNLKIIGSIDTINKIIEDEKIDRVIFSSQEISFNQMFAVVAKCQGLNVEFMVAGSESDYIVSKSSIMMLDDIPLVKVEYNISSAFHKTTKYSLDKVLGIAILLFVYPFIYFTVKLKAATGDFAEFILQVPRVISGEKSFVGPAKNSFYGDLYVGKPGLTGLWYIENIDGGDAGEIKKLDVFYAKNQNVWLDLEILGRTFSKMFFKSE